MMPPTAIVSCYKNIKDNYVFAVYILLLGLVYVKLVRLMMMKRIRKM